MFFDNFEKRTYEQSYVTGRQDGLIYQTLNFRMIFVFVDLMFLTFGIEYL